MDETNDDEYLLESIARTTGNEKLLRAFRQNPHSTLDIKRTAAGGLEIRLVKPGETFFSAVLFLLLVGVGIFALIGWIISIVYQSVFGPFDDAVLLCMIRSVLFGIYVCIEVWNKDNTWKNLKVSHRAILVSVILLAFGGGLTIEIMNGDTLGLAWVFAATGFIVRALFK